MSRLVREVRGRVLVERRAERKALKVGRVGELLDLAPEHRRQQHELPDESGRVWASQV